MVPSQALHKRLVNKLKCTTNVKVQTPCTHMNTNTNTQALTLGPYPCASGIGRANNTSYIMHLKQNIGSHTKRREAGRNEVSGLLALAHIPLKSHKPNHTYQSHIAHYSTLFKPKLNSDPKGACRFLKENGSTP